MAPLQGDPDEQALALRLRNGDGLVLRDILAVHGDRVDRSLRRHYGALLGSEDRDEVLSEALARLWAHRDRYETQRSLRVWLYIIARSVARDRLRRVLRQTDKAAQGEREEPSTGFSLLDREARNRATHILKEEMEKLPERDRDILRAYVTRQSETEWTSEVTERTGLSRNAVRVRRYRIMERLRQRILETLRSRPCSP